MSICSIVIIYNGHADVNTKIKKIIYNGKFFRTGKEWYFFEMYGILNIIK